MSGARRPWAGVYGVLAERYKFLCFAPVVRGYCLPHHISIMVGTWLRLALVCLSARGAASFDSGGDVPGSPGNLADAMRGAAWPASLCTARLHH
jgi:hypothetical protein